MNDLCTDVGYKSINHVGEELCGDHVDIVPENEYSRVIVLADGLGSGVKASILSTLTSKIISTMLAKGLSLEDCVSTIASTLPIDKKREVAYSTFTIIHLKNNRFAEIIQYDNPKVIMIRDDEIFDYPREELMMCGKKLHRASILLRENDMFVAMSDGCPHAGIGKAYNYGWKEEDIADFMSTLSPVGYTAKTLASILIDEVNKLYDGKPGDDATACVVRVRKRVPMNLLFGPPANPDDCGRMMELFFSKEGKHIVCGGTTSSIASKYLRKPVHQTALLDDSGIPPISSIEGVDLVTEGVITMNRVLDYAKDYLEDNKCYETWGFKKDGASQVSRLLFEEATDINIFAGRAINPAHQDPNLPITFSVKMQLVKELSECLTKMGKTVKVAYF